MIKETNLDRVKEVAINLLYIRPVVDETFSFVIHHPFIANNPVSNGKDFIDITDYGNFLKICNIMEKNIKEFDSIYRLISLVNVPYLLTFFKYCNKYLDKKDYANFLSHSWVVTENPNQDVNCPLSLIVKWFKKADKELLMTKEDYEYYNNLPETFEVYRGVGIGRNPNGISWTDNYEKAHWFAHRFDTKEKQGYILKAFVHKKDVLAYFNTRNEQEIVINPKNLQFIKEV